VPVEIFSINPLRQLLDICQTIEMNGTTTIKKKKDTQKKATRTKILESCMKVISLEGVDAVTHRAIGLAANLSGGVVSYHFKTREDLINETFIFHLQQLEVMSAAYAKKRTQTATGLVNAVVDFVKRDQASPHLVRADYEMILYASRRKNLAMLIKNWEDKIVAVLAEHLMAMGIPNKDRYARMIINLMRAFEIECMVNPSLELDELAKRIRLLLAGIKD
jgi:DNA-binding transcriptional regulator YbjK